MTIKIISKARFVLRVSEEAYGKLREYKNSPTLLSLYLFYQGESIRQGSLKIKATVKYCANALGWPPDKVRWVRNILISENLLYIISGVQSGDGDSYVVLNKMVEGDNRRWVI